MLTQPWRIEMLGGFCACLDTQRITRFKSQKAASLLAYLALYPSHPHSRDELLALCWPDDERDAARNRFRVTLNSLRRQLEPPDMPPGSILLADRMTLSLRSQAVTTDVREFEEALEAALGANEGESQIALLRRAVKAYHGELLPGFTDDWVMGERTRLSERHQQALHRLVRGLVAAQDLAGALSYALQAVQADGLREEAYRDVMRLYVALGQPSAALHWYAELERLLAEKLEARPAPSTRQLAAQIEERLGHGLAVVSEAPPNPAPAAVTPQEAMSPAQVPEPVRLPVPFTRFFGREPDIKALLSRLNDKNTTNPTRLLTLTGVGGAGKTRLAIETARQWQAAASEGMAHFVPLAELSVSRQIPAAIAASLRLPLSSGQDAFSLVCAALAARRTLLVLDNMEHLAEEAAPLVAALLAQIPDLTCLVTSRRSLGIEGEEEWTVAPLPLPESLPANSLSSLLACPSVQLFVDRARAVLPHFQLTLHNAADVSALCRDLEGIPLALELAAARTRVLTPGQMRTHLAQRFQLLVNSRASKDVRHRSLHATIEWSVQLLPPNLRSLFFELSVFHGGWSLEAAEAVLKTSANKQRENTWSLGEWETYSLLEGIEQLRIASLIMAEETGGIMRFRMLETLREFAALQLSHEAGERLAAQHAAFYTDLAEEARVRLKSQEQASCLKQLEQERHNLRAAYETARRMSGQSAAEMGLRLTRALWRFWTARGPLEEGREHAAVALAHAEAQEATALRAGALGAAGAMAAAMDDYTAAAMYYSEQQAVSRQIGFTQGLALSLDNLGCLELRRGNYAQARALVEESLSLYRLLEDKAGIALVLCHLALIADKQEDSAQAVAWSEESLYMHRELGDHLVVASILGNMGLIAERQGDLERAGVLQAQSLAIHQELGNRSGVAGLLINLGSVAIKQGNYDAGRTHLNEALRLFRELGIPQGIAMTLGSLGNLEYLLDNWTAAHSLQTQNLDIQCHLGTQEGIFLAHNSLALISAKLGDCDVAYDHFGEALALCRESGREGHMAEALETCAVLAEIMQQLTRAANLYGVAEAARERLNLPLYPTQQATRAATYSRLREVMGELEFLAAFSAGWQTRLDRAIEQAHSERQNSARQNSERQT